MKLKLYFIITLLTTSLLLFSFSRKSENDEVIRMPIDTTQNYLYLYGEYIYKRENCIKCHTLGQTQNVNILSLDGLNGKYPKSWHYIHLIDPQVVVVDSKMPSFSFLADRIFTKDSIGSKINPISKEDWEKEVEKAKNIKDYFKAENIDIKENAEILALIYFLDNIPTSNELKTIREKEKEKIALDDSLWLNAERTIKTVVKDKRSVKIGKNLFQTNCTPCHGKFGEGIIGPNLTDDYWIYGGNTLSIAKTITYGVPQKGMASWRYLLTPTEVGQLVAYIKSIKGSKPLNAKEKQGIKE